MMHASFPRPGGHGKIFGVNYGNRFIPEEWMMTESHDFFQGIRAGGREPNGKRRVSLCDVTDSARMFRWLDDTIQESDFKRMQEMGVQVVRVPCGYWNWVSFPAETAPNAPDSRLRNLHMLGSPSQFEPYFHRIFEFARRCGIKVLLDLHGAPGSQNGEMHSGASLPVGHFGAGWNCDKAVEAISNMSAFAARKCNCFGVQLLNEPQDLCLHFLESYYRKAILAARRHLHPKVPIILFSWTYHFDHWQDNHFDYSEYGNVMWDTHVYHFPEDGESWTSSCGGLQKVTASYAEDLELIKDFHRRQPGGCIVGEFSLAGPTLNKVDNRKLAKWLVQQFCNVCHGCLFWNFDGPSIDEWNMSRGARAFGIDWRLLTHFILQAYRTESTAIKDAATDDPFCRTIEPVHFVNYGQHNVRTTFLLSWLPAVPLQQLVKSSLIPRLVTVVQQPMYTSA